ncbi:RNA polymerase sigma-70 factor [Sunxiuqinia sp. A32]|uniref:RNA polymerase sigma-70 factor n=1 Tax=Sunxiuqinia sp. A32 TaxID=3461496 RepID=UPI0040465020
MNDLYENTELRFVDGSRIDLKEFFFSYFSELSLFANKYISDLSVCEDIVQDVFIALWQKQKKIQNLLAAKSFIYKSVRNSCLDYLKHIKVEERYLEYKRNDDEVSDSFIEEIIKAEAYSQVHREIDKLPNMGKKVLLLAMKDIPNEEIARMLDISINTIRTHKARAYRVLRNNLKDIFLYYIISKITPSLK